MTTDVNTRRYGLVAAAATLVLVVVIALVATMTGRADATSSPAAGSSPDNPIVLASPNDVPSGAVEDATSTYNTAGACDTTRSWVNTVPGTNAVTHNEWTAEQSTRTKSQVPTYKTQYHFSKFTRIKTKAPATKAVWANFAPTNTREPFVGPAKWPTDARGKWIIHNAIPGGHEGPNGVYSKGDPSKGGNWFYRLNAVEASWSAYSAWTKWTPETHTSWEDSNAPLGTPQFHGQGTYSDGTQWYREWQAQFDGATRQVQTGTTTQYSEWSAWTPYGTNPYRTEPVLPANTDTRRYQKHGPVVVTDSAATPAVVTYYAWSDGKVCETSTPTPPVAIPPTTTPEPPVVTPPSPEPKVKPRVDVSTRCTGTTRFVLDNRKSETTVPFKLKGGKWSNKVNVSAGQKVVVVKRLPNGVRAVVSTVGDRDAVTVPNPCPKPPRQTPHTGLRK